MLKKVPAIKTTYSDQEIVDAIVMAWQILFNQIPKKESVGVLVSQNWHETAKSQYMYCNNIGNLKAKDDPNSVIEYMSLKGVWEIVNGKKVYLSEDDPGSWFRAFPTLLDGMKHHLNFLKNKRYRIAWAAVEAGNPLDFCTKLKQQGYFTDSVENYSKGVLRYYNQYMSSKLYETAIAKLKINPVEQPSVIIAENVEDIEFHPYNQLDNVSIISEAFSKGRELVENDPKLTLSWIQKIISFIIQIINKFSKK